ncbi:MAG: methionyl-tRNA formyltransferase [candidate division Zixibacteria bacterium]|nr:methionyl-tRNA formyltransferase [candidate division Zixibacteria bacterium]
MRIIFMGNPGFAVPSLERLHQEKHQIAAVVTNPDKPSGRGRKLNPPAVKLKARELGLDVIQPAKIKDRQFIDRLYELEPELFVIVAFRILPKKLLEIPRKGSINLHASLLPRYRGAAPINWAIIKGEKETGISTFFLKPKVDTGDIILQEKVEIPPDMVYGQLYEELAVKGADVLAESVKLIEQDKINPIPQDESMASHAPKITPELCEIDFNRNCRQVADLIRGLSPKPGATTSFRDRKIKLLRADCIEGNPGGEAGEIRIDEKSKDMLVSCADGCLRILTLQPAGKKPMDARGFFNGYHPETGEKMGGRAV